MSETTPSIPTGPQAGAVPFDLVDPGGRTYEKAARRHAPEGPIELPSPGVANAERHVLAPAKGGKG